MLRRRYITPELLAQLEEQHRKLEARALARQLRAEKPKLPPSPAKEAVNQRLKEVGRIWATLTQEEARTWDEYSKLIHQSERRLSFEPRRAANNLFTSLTTRFLAVNPNAEPPRTAPPYIFGGEGVSVNVTTNLGELTFTANRPNNPDITTELLIKKLKDANKLGPMTGFRSQGFITFTPDNLTQTLTLPRGNYGAAVRFIRTDTGQATSILVVGRVEVR